MVAYSFHPMFRGQVADLTKLQTVRAHRRRHARPDEAVQLYSGMRTKHCRKLVEPDPTCTSVVPIAIDVRQPGITAIEVEGVWLTGREIEAFAILDGFAPVHCGEFEFPSERGAALKPATARYWMSWFWKKHHGLGLFEGVLIRWRPAQ